MESKLPTARRSAGWRLGSLRTLSVREFMRDHLKTLARLLQENGESVPAAIADCAGGPDRSEGRRGIERLLLQLGKEQIRSRKANQRTEMWATAFSNWEKAGI